MLGMDSGSNLKRTIKIDLIEVELLVLLLHEVLEDIDLLLLILPLILRLNCHLLHSTGQFVNDGTAEYFFGRPLRVACKPSWKIMGIIQLCTRAAQSAHEIDCGPGHYVEVIGSKYATEPVLHIPAIKVFCDSAGKQWIFPIDMGWFFRGDAEQNTSLADHTVHGIIEAVPIRAVPSTVLVDVVTMALGDLAACAIGWK
ncbi:hypothetical protein PRIPAC_82213 [Pristionchus pacificus]|uniref:Uncharacterized protein n=1 Tax=Pristionchus pacificus TaxID=54126 RepID=A0A2A6CKP4_PRIPA|nr:hypothetical protein PRIPAC_82213 [Pristionchus pacificus]|eukprot:PDM78689.1 hypothetical protein PRIPAC_31268 [Pristionchus pacificus]